MININNLLQFYPPKVHAFKLSILREYLQYKILNKIYSHELSKKLCFIWWTALRIWYGFERFSEDLDFDNWWLTTDEFEELGKVIVRDLELDGYEVESKIIYKWAYHLHIKIPKLLFENNLAGMPTEKLVIKIDTIAQWLEYKPSIININKFGYNTNIYIAPIDVLLSMKIRAFFDRIKGRDIYDIVWLRWYNAKPIYNLISEIASNPQELQDKIIARNKDLDIDKLQSDVAPFLMDGDNQAVANRPRFISQTKRE